MVRYRLLDAIGRGGHGVVHRAQERSTGGLVAVKLLTTPRPELLHALRRESGVLRRLSHPNVVRVLDAGEDPTWGPFLAMDLESGATLADVMQGMDWPRCRSLLGQVLTALAHVHARGVVHGDVKPSNVLLSAGGRMARLTDFGVARVVGSSGSVGTPTCASPEQIRGMPATVASDLYSVGCVAYALLTGHTPFPSLTGVELLQAHVSCTPAPPTPRFPAPVGVEALVERLLAKDPRDRFPTAGMALRALRALDDALALRSAPAPAGWAPSDTATVLPPSRTPRPSVLGLAEPAQVAPQLVGRAREVQALREHLDAVVATGRSRVVAVVGSEGAGRSTLARSFLVDVDEAG